MIFVSSWDDGHPLDTRIAELLRRFGLKGTFFVPIRNCEGRPVLTANAVRELDSAFEVGSHTLDHVYLAKLSQSESERQIIGGKESLEQIVGHDVEGFCYPGGKFSARNKRTVAKAGFRYARTTENLRVDIGIDPYAVPTTMQFYPHGRGVLFRNFLRFGNYAARYMAASAAIASPADFQGLIRLMNNCVGSEMVIHLWGHSWEIDDNSLWFRLQTLFAEVARLQIESMSVNELVLNTAKIK